MKSFTKIVIVLFLIICLGICYLGINNADRDGLIPYKLNYQAQVAGAKNADVLIVGDQLGEVFNSQIEAIVEELSQELNKPISIYNLSKNNYNIYRIEHLLESISKDTESGLPPVIIYLGGMSEFYERMLPKNLNLTYFNFKLYKNQGFRTLITLFPFLTKFLFIPEKTVVLNEQPVKEDFNDKVFLVYSEIYYYLYEKKLKDIARLIEKNNSIFIPVIPAVNLFSDKLRACKTSSNDEVNHKLDEAQALIDQKKNKEALSLLHSLNTIATANSKISYLYGLSLYNTANFKQAKKQLELAKAYNCEPQYAHPIINSIILKTVKLRSLNYINFDDMVNRNFGKNELFLNDLEPQSIYLESLKKEITIMLKDVLTL